MTSTNGRMSETELAEAFQHSPSDYADMCARYYALKTVLAYVIEGGEVVKKWDHNREEEALNGVLRKRVEEKGPIHVEGLPPLILEPSSTTHLRLDALVHDVLSGDPKATALLDELERGGLIDVKWGACKALQKAGQLRGLKGYTYEGHGTPRLKFDKR